MATTTYLSIEIPDVGADNNTWGTITNAAWNSFDACLRPTGNGTSVGLNVGAGNTLTVAGAFAGGSATTFAMPATATAGGSVVVTLAGTQTLTNKTLTEPTINTGTLATPVFTGTPTGTVTAGTYTPTLGGTASTNVASDTLQAAWYSRVGNVVTGGVTAFVTASAASKVTLSISLPVASNFSSAYQAAGSVWAEGSATLVHGRLVGSSADDNMVIQYTPGDTSAHEVSILFSYVVI